MIFWRGRESFYKGLGEKSFSVGRKKKRVEEAQCEARHGERSVSFWFWEGCGHFVFFVPRQVSVAKKGVCGESAARLAKRRAVGERGVWREPGGLRSDGR